MFDLNSYREDCAQLSLGQEKLEEMISMTENTNKKNRFARPMRTMLVAAACVAALCVTAMAAPAVQKLFMSFSITVTDPSGSTRDAQMFVCPDLSLEKREGRDILTVNEKEIDVTDAFAKEGQYVMEEDGSVVTVHPDGQVEVSMGDIVYTFKLGEEAPVGIKVPEGDGIGSYIVSDQNGGIEVSPAE